MNSCSDDYGDEPEKTPEKTPPPEHQEATGRDDLIDPNWDATNGC